MTTTATLPLHPDALDANRGGRMTDAQKAGMRNREGNIERDKLTFAGILAVIGVLLLTATGPAPNAAYRPIAAIGFLAAAAFVLFLAMPGTDSLSQDIRSGKVESLEGPIGKRRISTESHSSNSTIYYLDVERMHFEVAYSTYEAAPEAGMVRLFYLPRSKVVVNLEQLADVPVPAGAFDSPTAVLKDIATAFKSHDQVERLDARAEMAAMEHTMQAQMAAARIVPTGERDPRPLAETVIGTWRAGPMTVTFAPDGSLSSMAVGIANQSHWSVDDSGHLHAQIMGRDQVAEAWVTGDSLVIKAEGESMTFTRVTAG